MSYIRPNLMKVELSAVRPELYKMTGNVFQSLVCLFLHSVLLEIIVRGSELEF